nr:hypothetical protein [uncultured Actinotalea sp.]
MTGESGRWGRPGPDADVAPGADRGEVAPGAGFRRSAASWIRAYPPRWRRARGAELLGLLEDLAEPGASRLGVRQVADVVRGGLATRWRERPPLGAWGGRVVVWTGLAAALPVAEAVGSLPVGWSLVIGAAAWALLPVAVVVLRTVRRTPGLVGAAAVDVARVASGGRAQVDRADATAFVPWGVVGWSPGPSSRPRPVT